MKEKSWKRGAAERRQDNVTKRKRAGKNDRTTRKDEAAGREAEKTRGRAAWTPRLILGIAIFGLLVFGIVLARQLILAEPVIAPGVCIGSRDGVCLALGGMNREQAQEAVAKLEEMLAQTTVIVEREASEDRAAVQIGCTLKDLGWHLEHDYVEEALRIGNTGGFLQRYRERRAAGMGNYCYTLTGEVEPEAVKDWLEREKAQFEIPAVNAGIGRIDGRFCYTEHRQGSSLLTAQTLLALSAGAEAVDEFVREGELRVRAVMQPELPEVTTEDAMRCDTLIGSYTTAYRVEAGAARAHNLTNGAEKLNRTVLYPGEELSCEAVLGPFTQENGYLGAGSYAAGNIVESIGGGVCQISSTLYNAVLEAELAVTERSSHSMTVSYVPLGRDAAIAWQYKDFRFQNSTRTPIYIEAEAGNGRLTIRIWGEETGENGREVQFESVIVREIPPGDDIITRDASYPAGYRQVTQKARTGYEVNLYKIVLIDGQETSRELVNTSRYAAEPAHVTVGTGR